MQKVDMVIALVGALAIVATTLGVVLYDEIAGKETLEFELVTDEGYYASATESPVSGANFPPISFEVPDNSTEAEFEVTITFRGRSGQEQNVAVSAYFQDPTDNRSNEDQGSIAIPANDDAGGQSVTLTLKRAWATAPEGGNTTDVDQAAKDATTSYKGKLITVYVTIAAVDDPLTGIPGVGINYVYDVTVTGDLTRYQRDVPEVSAPTGGP